MLRLSTLYFDKIFNGARLRNGANAFTLPISTMDKYMQLASTYGMPVFSYEGGQYMVGVSGVENNDNTTQRELRGRTITTI